MSRKFWTPLYTTLRRTLPSKHPYLPANSAFRFPSPTYFFSPPSPSSSPNSPFSSSYDFYSLQNPKFPVRIFCFSTGAEEQSSARCWSCGAVAIAAPFLVCETCRSVQPMDHSVDYFQIFGLEKKYDIEVQNLEGKYKDWQKKLHPDLVHSKSQRERGYAAEQSARLRLEGVDVDEEETLTDPELLSEILEIREAVEEAADPLALNEIKSQMNQKLNHWSNSFTTAFRCRKFEEAVNSIRRMTYYERVTEEIVKKL